MIVALLKINGRKLFSDVNKMLLLYTRQKFFNATQNHKNIKRKISYIDDIFVKFEGKDNWYIINLFLLNCFLINLMNNKGYSEKNINISQT